jgi:hypothetical protein
VAVGFRLAADQLEAVQQALGPGFVVEDIRRASPDAAIVVIPPCSPGAIQAVRRTFPTAHILVVEADTGAPEGAIGRALAAGASGYARTAGVGGLVASVRWAVTRPVA